MLGAGAGDDLSLDDPALLEQLSALRRILGISDEPVAKRPNKRARGAVEQAGSQANVFSGFQDESSSTSQDSGSDELSTGLEDDILLEADDDQLAAVGPGDEQPLNDQVSKPCHMLLPCPIGDAFITFLSATISCYTCACLQDGVGMGWGAAARGTDAFTMDTESDADAEAEGKVSEAMDGGALYPAQDVLGGLDNAQADAGRK